MSKYGGGFTQANYRISVTLPAIITSQGIVRQETATSIVLGSIEGCKRYIAECHGEHGLVSLKVVDMRSGKDITNEFVGGIRFVRSRHNQPIQAYDIRRL